MKLLLLRVQIAAAVVAACVRAVVHRIRRGPTLPSWTWSEELFRAGFRAFAGRRADHLVELSTRTSLKGPIRRGVRDLVTIDDVDLDGVPALRFRPIAPRRGTIVYFHGGGFVSGSPNVERGPAADQASQSACEAFSIDYRLAPLHPFPAALDDAIAAYRAILELGADPTTTVFTGGSAGAGLVLSALLKIRELGLPMPGGAVLLWPYADFTFSGESIDTNAEVDMLPLRDLAEVWGPAYVGEADPADPLVSPALADLTGLPPLLVIAGGAESLLSCAEQVAANAERDGVEVTFSVYPEKVHGWMILPNLPETKQAEAEVHAFIGSHVGAPPNAIE